MTMNKKHLGNSGLLVSRLCLGAMMFGGATEDAQAQRIIADAEDRGVNFVDTADVYNDGRSEAVVGAALAGRRDNWIVATKFGAGAGAGDPNRRGQSRRWIIASVEASLRRLHMDHIDILYFHMSFGDATLPQALRAIGDLISQGKIRYYGISNFTAWRLGLVCQLADQLNIDRPVVSQPPYSIVDRTAEREHLPAARHYGLGVVSYSPLARGILTGKYGSGAKPSEDSRVGRNDFRIMQTEWRPESLLVAEKIASRAAARGMSSIDFAIGWVLANPAITSVIAGPRTEEQWRSYISAASIALDAEDELFIDRLVAPGHPSTPGYNDPLYPVEGRFLP